MDPLTMEKLPPFPARAFLLSLCLLLASSSEVSLAQTKTLEIEVAPTSLAVSPAGTATPFVLILRNSGDSEIQKIDISWTPEDGVGLVPPEPIQIPKLGAHTALSKIFSVSQTSLSAIDRSLLLTIDYKDSSGPKVIAQAISVKSREAESVDKLVEAKVQTTLETLDSSRSGTIELFLTNKRGQPITLKVTGNGPEFICFDPTKPVCPESSSNDPPTLAKTSETTISIKPYETVVHRFIVRAQKRVEPGKYSLSFEIAVANAAGQPAGSTVLSQTVDVGVLGESAILKALSVPSFLFLPGCLVMLTLGFFSKYGWSWSKPAKSNPIPEATDPYFWLAGISISGIMALLYRWIWHRWYFASYGIEDIAQVWLYSVLLGLVLYLFFFGRPRLIEYLSTPTAQDDPIKVLERLKWQGRRNIVIERRTIGADPNKKTVCVISKVSEDGKSVWVSAGINVYVTKAKGDLQEEIRKALDASGSPGKLAEILRRADKNATETTGEKETEIAVWDTTSIPNPTFTEVTNLAASGPSTIAVEKN